MAQQNVPQGTLNRLRASVVINDFTELNVTADYLGPEGIRLSFDDNATDLLPTMTGMVSSPKPYQACTLTMAIVKSTPLAPLYQTQFETDTLLGAVTVYPDANSPSSAGLSSFALFNMALENVREMSFSGNEASLFVTMRGYYQVNQGYFSN